MNINTRMEEFSIAHISLLASHGGFTINKEPTGIDNVGIDITVKDPTRLYEMPPCQFSAQVKCTRKTKLKVKGSEVFYPLRRKNYDNLIKSQPGNTILLILVVVPEDINDWINSDDFSTVVKHCCYWFCLQNYPTSNLKNEDSKEDINFVDATLLTPNSLSLLMQQIADGEI